MGKSGEVPGGHSEAQIRRESRSSRPLSGTAVLRSNQRASWSSESLPSARFQNVSTRSSLVAVTSSPFRRRNVKRNYEGGSLVPVDKRMIRRRSPWHTPAASRASEGVCFRIGQEVLGAGQSRFEQAQITNALWTRRATESFFDAVRKNHILPNPDAARPSLRQLCAAHRGSRA